MNVKFHPMKNGLIEVLLLNDDGLCVEVLEFLK